MIHLASWKEAHARLLCFYDKIKSPQMEHLKSNSCMFSFSAKQKSELVFHIAATTYTDTL